MSRLFQDLEKRSSMASRLFAGKGSAQIRYIVQLNEDLRRIDESALFDIHNRSDIDLIQIDVGVGINVGDSVRDVVGYIVPDIIAQIVPDVVCQVIGDVVGRVGDVADGVAQVEWESISESDQGE
ncbi:hypothetical protein PRZ48_014893 [Zasmidium cellare]|uniref:Uncharacterized protein n=1 Tax=Zasmidium cellare TaxID=395010 RepID=A0ABR0DXP1_ZASCE|nr:hypothetical protein PRZ48_014893 [Zasmidium cellare]